jgi:hypothetical protein
VEWQSHVKAADGTSGASVESFDVSTLIALGGGGSVDLLKVDIEGGEAEVFGKKFDEWLPAVRNITIEFHGSDCEKNFYAALNDYEYESFEYRTVMICRNIRPRAAVSTR